MDFLKRYKKQIMVVFNLIIVLFSIALLLHNVMHITGATFVISTIVMVMLLVDTIFYCLFDFKKDVRIYYQLYVLFFAILLLVQTYASAKLMEHPIKLVGFALSFGAVLVLMIGRDLGGLKSKILAAIPALFYAGSLISAIVLKAENDLLFREITGVLLAFLLMFMVFDKYIDKKERGKK